MAGGQFYRADNVLVPKHQDIGMLINQITLKKLINELNVREKEVIILRYFKDKTQTEVSKMLGISQVQVSRIEKKILLQMREKISI